MGLKVLMIGTYPVEPGVVCGGVESATSALVPALARRDDIDSVTPWMQTLLKADFKGDADGKIKDARTAFETARPRDLSLWWWD